MNGKRFSKGRAVACGLTLMAGLMGLALGAGAVAMEEVGVPGADICRSARG